MATVQKEVRKRGFFGKIVKWIFILFNVLMIVWLFSYCSHVADMSQTLTDDAEKAGAAIGGAMGTGFLLSIWAAGDIILGIFAFFTRGTKYIITEEVEDKK